MSAQKDLEKIDPADSKCRYKQYEMHRLNHLQSHLEKTMEEVAAGNKPESELTMLSNRLMPLISNIQEAIKKCTDLLTDCRSSKHSIANSCSASSHLINSTQFHLPMLFPKNLQQPLVVKRQSGDHLSKLTSQTIYKHSLLVKNPVGRWRNKYAILCVVLLSVEHFSFPVPPLGRDYFFRYPLILPQIFSDTPYFCISPPPHMFL